MGLGDAFGKEQQETLNYDADAFYLFAYAVLFAILMPLTVRAGLRAANPPRGKCDFLVDPQTKGSKPRTCTSTAMLALFDESTRQRSTLSRRFPLGTWVPLLMLWALAGVCVLRAADVREMRSFDPFAILEVSNEATIPEIKKAYRGMSLKLHPDVNPDDPLAQAKFMRLTKAYQSLTEETARQNYLKYGNPDGPSGLKVSVALHPILMDKEYQLVTMISFFLILFVAAPFGAVRYYRSIKGISPQGVLFTTLDSARRCCDPEVRPADTVALLGVSEEFVTLLKAPFWGPTDTEQLEKLLAAHWRWSQKEVGDESEAHMQHRQGVMVMFDNLQKSVDLNGKIGRVDAYDASAGRYSVRLNAKQVPAGDKAAKAIRPDNLTPVGVELPSLFDSDTIKATQVLLYAYFTRLVSVAPDAKFDAPILAKAAGVLKQILPTGTHISRSIAALGVNRSNMIDASVSLLTLQRGLVQAIAPVGVLAPIPESQMKEPTVMCKHTDVYCTEAVRAGEEFLQLPHISHESARALFAAGHRMRTAVADVPAFVKVLGAGVAALPIAGKKKDSEAEATAAAFRQRFSEGELADVEKSLSHLPNIKLRARATVHGETLIARGDMLTVEISLMRQNLSEGEEAGLVHAPHFPGPRLEEWWLLLMDAHTGHRLAFNRCEYQGRNAEVSLTVPLQFLGDARWTLYALCDSYYGLDASVDLKFHVSKPHPMARQTIVHPDDRNLRTTFEQLMQLDEPAQESDSESDGRGSGGESTDTEDEDELLKRREERHERRQRKKHQKLLEEAKVRAEESSKAEKEPEEDSDVDDESDDAHNMYEVVSMLGMRVTRELLEGEDAPEKPDGHPDEGKPRVTMLAPGSFVRGWEEKDEKGVKVLLAGSPHGMYIRASITDKEGKGVRGATKLGAFVECKLGNIAQAPIPITLVRRWIKHNPASRITPIDLHYCTNLAQDVVRSRVLHFIREKLGDEEFDTLHAGMKELQARRRELAMLFRGVWRDHRDDLWKASGEDVHWFHEGQKLSVTLLISDDADSARLFIWGMLWELDIKGRKASLAAGLGTPSTLMWRSLADKTKCIAWTEDRKVSSWETTG